MPGQHVPEHLFFVETCLFHPFARHPGLLSSLEQRLLELEVVKLLLLGIDKFVKLHVACSFELLRDVHHVDYLGVRLYFFKVQNEGLTPFDLRDVRGEASPRAGLLISVCASDWGGFRVKSIFETKLKVPQSCFTSERLADIIC